MQDAHPAHTGGGPSQSGMGGHDADDRVFGDLCSGAWGVLSICGDSSEGERLTVWVQFLLTAGLQRETAGRGTMALYVQVRASPL